MTTRVFPEPDRHYRVALLNGRFVGKLLAIEWEFGSLRDQEIRIRPETLVFEVLAGWEKGEPVWKRRIVRWGAVAWLDEAEPYEALVVDDEP